jgi:hypothetical protein
VSRSVWGRCGAPDVITKERTDHDKAPFIVDYTRKTSFDSASDDSSVYSENAEQLSFIDEEIEEEAKGAEAKDCDSDSESDDDDPISQIIAQKSPTRLTIKLNVTDKISSSWDSVSMISALTLHPLTLSSSLGLGSRQQHLVRRFAQDIDSGGQQAIVPVSSGICRREAGLRWRCAVHP